MSAIQLHVLTSLRENPLTAINIDEYVCRVTSAGTFFILDASLALTEIECEIKLIPFSLVAANQLTSKAAC